MCFSTRGTRPDLYFSVEIPEKNKNLVVPGPAQEIRNHRPVSTRATRVDINFRFVVPKNLLVLPPH